MRFLENPSTRRVLIILLDLAVILGAYFASFWLRFDFALDPNTTSILIHTIALAAVIHAASCAGFGLYRGIYHFSSFADLVHITNAAVVAGSLTALSILFIRQGHFPRSILILHPLLTFLGICGIRFAIRLGKNYAASRRFSLADASNAILVGAGELGESLARQIMKSPEAGYNIIGFIDDDKGKWGMRIHGIPVLGGISTLPELIRQHRVDDVIIAISRRRGEIVASVMASLRGLDSRPDVKVAPSLDEMLQSPGHGQLIRKVRPADLLNREIIHLDEPQISRVIERKVVLVTGAGGTIGSELCRQVLSYRPEKIVLLECHATSLFFAESRLREESRGTAVISVLGDVRDQGLIERIFKTHRPNVVLHAAAHKHVHQLEFNLQEGVSNNLLGTHFLAGAADKFGADCFLLVSTDKAVRPSSVMGATKRAAERVLQYWATRSNTRFCAVRFGNVLGSSGSVLPIFEDQISKGGPVTVTDAKATRYFMTVEEAVGLILQAASMAQGGEIFILKMGTPVRILDMARNLILLSGREPDKDIEIRITGLKQGEKLDEELADEPSQMSQSANPDISVLKNESQDLQALPDQILEMEILTRGTEPAPLLRKLREFVPSFRPAETLLNQTP